MASGLNLTDRLKSKGFEVIKDAQPKIWVGALKYPPPGHALFHDRQHDPLDPDLVEDIAKRGILEVGTIMEDGDNLWIIDCSQRVNHGLAAEELNWSRGVRHPKTGERVRMMMKFKNFKGSCAEALVERARCNADPFKKPDRPSVLASTYIRIVALGVDEKDLVHIAPRGVGPVEIQALLDWPNLVADLVPRFDSGEIPLGLLPAVLRVSRDKQVETAEKLLLKKVSHPRGATRATNREKKEAAGERAERPHPSRMRKCGTALLELPAKVRETPLAIGLRVGLQAALGKKPDVALPAELKALIDELLATPAR